MRGCPERPVVRFRPERASKVIGLEIAADEQRDDADRIRLRRRRRLERDASRPGARATSRARSTCRGGRAAGARPDPAHDAAAPARAGPAVEGAAPAACRRGRARRRRAVRGVHVEPRRLGSEIRRDPAPEPDDLRPGDPANDDRPGARRRGDARRRRRAPSTSALFEIARVYLPSGEQLPDEHWRVAGVVQGGYEVVKGVVETLYDALGLELRVERGSHELLHPGKAAATEPGGSASSTRRCSTGRGERSSSTSRRSSPPCPT